MDYLRSLPSNASSALSSHRGQLALTAIASGALVGSSILAFQEARQLSRVRRLKRSIPDATSSTTLADFGALQGVNVTTDNATGLTTRAAAGEWDEALILEQLARNRVFMGNEGLQKVRNSFIIVVGLGGVGSHASAMLVRSGVARIRLVDFDNVTLSSLNRHAVATLDDVGTPKVHAMRKHLHHVAPWVDIDAQNMLWDLDVAEELLAGKPDFVVDAIDNVETKVDLLHYCSTLGIPVISSMGAGCKGDPTRVHVGDIADSIEDPLSRTTRRLLRKKGVATGIPVVFSVEKPGPGKAKLLPLSDEEFQKGKVEELGVLPDFRVRILPVLGTMPAVFGLCVANYILTSISGYPVDYSGRKGREGLYADMLAKLTGQESRLRGKPVGLRLALTENDAGYLIEEVFRGKSVVSGYPTRLALSRWTPLPRREDGGFWGIEEEKLGIDNVVLMTKEEVKKHEQEVLVEGKTPEDVWGAEVVQRVKQRQQEEACYAIYR